MRYTKVYVTVTARNVLFSKRTEDFLKGLQDRAANPGVKKYIKSNLRNWLINSFEDVEQIRRPKAGDPDWLKTALERGDEVYSLDLSPREMETISHWLDYLNTVEGDVSRISIPQLQKKVKEWEESFAKQKANEEDGIELVHEYPDGFSWVNVFGKDSLNREGKLMNHCVGSYYNQVKSGGTSIYSLRDKNNKPHCTIELSRNEIQQIKGNSNSLVKEQYRKYVIDFLKKKYVKFKGVVPGELHNINLIQIDNKIYDLDHLPNGLVVKGDLDLFGTKITSLPEGLEVGGDLDLRHSRVTSLPKGLKVGGTLDLYGAEVVSLPDDIKIGNLDASYSILKYLPENLKIKGYLNISGTRITSLPNGLEVGDDLYIMDSGITSLPKDLKVGGEIVR